MKCKHCGKNFNTTAFGDTYCPYCGTKVSKEDEEKIRYFEYNQGDIIVKKVLKYRHFFLDKLIKGLYNI